MRLKSNLLSILFWSIISAAFIGPGTITTCAKAGAAFGYSLLWALTFSTLACIILQEAAARVTIVSGKNLGQAIEANCHTWSQKIIVRSLIVGAIILGCAAYQTGNFLGAKAGLALIFPQYSQISLLLIALLAFLILWIPSLQMIATFLGWIVIIMGVVFCSTAILLQPNWGEIITASFVPQFQPQSGWLVLGLIGTTVVPYNLFLGSGLSKFGQNLHETRLGISVAVGLGGLISMAVLVVGTGVSGNFSFLAISQTLETKLGSWASIFFAIGLFAAGFSSAITAPLASAITAQSLFGNQNPSLWSNESRRYRAVWILVWVVGFLLAMSEIQPIPAIILAQAFNGLVLPLVSIFLVWVMNNVNILGEKNINSLALNLITAIVLEISLLLGLLNINKALQSITGWQIWQSNEAFWAMLLISLLISVWVWWIAFKARKPNEV